MSSQASSRSTSRANRETSRQTIRSQYLFVASEEEAFSVFGRSEVQDLNRLRACTDVPCLLLFLFTLAGMMFFDSHARSHGTTNRLFEPVDFQGKLCGYDDGVQDKPLGYRPNPYSDMIICVSSCPKTPADGNFTLPDGPMGKCYTRPAYATANILGQNCLPLDLQLAKHMITRKSVQTELYKSFAMAFTALHVMLLILLVPIFISMIYILMLFYVPNAAATLAFTSTAATMALTGLIMDLDMDALLGAPLYRETHPLMLMLHPYVRDVCYSVGITFATFWLASIGMMRRTKSVFKECVDVVLGQDSLQDSVLFAALGCSVVRIVFILHACRHSALLMSIINPVEVKVQILGESHDINRNAWSPYYIKALLFYAWMTYWVLEFMRFCNKYITASVLCHNYFLLPTIASAGSENKGVKKSPLVYAFYSLFRYHLGSVAFAAFMSVPVGITRWLVRIFVPDKPNLQNSVHRVDRLAYCLFRPLVWLDLNFLRFFSDSAWVMIALKGYPYMDAAARSEGLLNRCRGKIPNLAKFTNKTDSFLNISVGLSAMVWAFFFFREPRHGDYHSVAKLTAEEALEDIFVTPEHSPLLVLPVIFAFGIWVGEGVLHLIGMAAESLTVCYCIDVEMAGGTETDALHVPRNLAEVYKDLGGGESERELAEMMAQSGAL